MNADGFALWLQGYFELSDVKTLNENQVQIIKEHLKLVFNKVTPDIKPQVKEFNPKQLSWFEIWDEQEKERKRQQELSDLLNKPRIYCDTAQKIC